MDQATRSLFHWISALIAMPAAIYAARPFFASAWGALSKGRANMDVPISLAVCLALGISVAETLRHGPHAYFDAAVMLLFFLLIGRWLDHALRRRARQAARDLLALQATAASRIGADGALTSVPAKTLEVGDQIALAPGERAAADMVVVTGASEADFSLATGESAPRPVKPGDALVSGVVNLTAPLTARVTAKASDSFLADLARLVEAGEQAKTRYVRLADKAAKLYVPLVHTAAALVFAGWWILGGDLRVALINAIALLIITCPCALALAAPAVQVVATGRLFRRGVLVKSGDALERLGQADAALFDKTGTLTLATLRLRTVDAVPPHALETAARLARASRHPIARALADAAGPGPMASDVREHPGLGLEAEVDGIRVRLGSAAWVEARAAAAPVDSASFVWLRLGEAAPIALRLEANLRPGAREAVEGLRQRGLDVEMLTGDAPGPAKEVADALAMTHWRAEASPQAKAARLDALAAQGRRALMIGDGLNDAPALAKAHVSASPGSALEASQNAADFVIQGERLDPIVEALDTARAARRRTLENFTFAAVYNCCAVPLAAAGMVTPLIAALAMSGSSLIVTLNALRLARGPKTTETA